MSERITRREFLVTTAKASAIAFYGYQSTDPSLTMKERQISVLGAKMNYLTAGTGKTAIVFLHGNPTRAHLWRNIIPYVSSMGFCVAPDLIGMGGSDKLGAEVTDRYQFSCHQRFLNAFLSRVLKHSQRVILVGHDWGGVLAHDWARRNSKRVEGIALMETFLEPNMTGQTPEQVIQWFGNFRTEEFKHKVLAENYFLEQIFLKSLPELAERDREIYRSAYQKEEDRLPTLIWPREVPIDRNPELTYNVFLENIAFMSGTRIPKLFISADPGALLSHEVRKNTIRQWPELTEVKVKGNHYIQEQCPDDIGKALAEWLVTLLK